MAKAKFRVSIRMYCLGTGDCFVLKFYKGSVKNAYYTMMIDCGSCQGGPKEFKPYIENLAAYVDNKIDLLVITHEHNDHVNGFAKCRDIFEGISIKAAWFAWTENPDDPDGYAAELQKKRTKLKKALKNAIAEVKERNDAYAPSPTDDYFSDKVRLSANAFLSGLNTLADINLAEGVDGSKALPGMVAIKEILKAKKVKPKYLNPGETISIPALDGIKFYVLGPPKERDFIFKDGKIGTDVYKKNLSLNESALAANAFNNLSVPTASSPERKDLPFEIGYVANTAGTDAKPIMDQYIDPINAWRNINDDWLRTAGSLALRLNSHINNTSLVLAIEFQESEKVILFPGDAEFGSWESWHLIKKWLKKGKDDKPWAEDLLNRTVFYKVGHHLSYNGTALEKGIKMMESGDLVAMATLDRRRISKGWKSTMPNKYLMKELFDRCQGRLIIMDEFEIPNGPSKQFDFDSLAKSVYETGYLDEETVMYKQYVVSI
jgi:hypothetical protein